MNSTSRPLAPALLLLFAATASAQIIANPAALTFNLASGSTSAQGVLLTGPVGTGFSAGVSTLTGTGWLSVTPASGTFTTNTAQVVVTVNAIGLATGAYTGNLTMFNSGAFTVVQITANVSPPSTSALVVSPNPITMTVAAGASIATQTTTAIIQNTGTSSASFLLSATLVTSTGCPSANFTVLPTASSLASGQAMQFIVGIAAPSFVAGTCQGLLIVSPTVGTAFTVPINVTVASNAQLTSTPASLAFFYQVGTGNIPAVQSFSVNTTDNSVVPVTITQSSNPNNWLALGSSTAATGPGGAPILAAIASAQLLALPVGTYNGQITVTSGTAGAVTNSPLIIPVTLTVTNQPLITTSPSILTFTSGGQIPPSVAVQIATTGAAVSFIAQPQVQFGSWLSVTPGSGTASLGSPATLIVSANPAGLASGTYVGSVLINAPGASNSTVAIPVTLTVTVAPQLTLNPSQVVFNYQIGQNLPPSQPVTFTSTGVPLAYTVDPVSVSWLLTAGRSPTTTPDTLTLFVNPGSLSPGSNNTQVVLRSSAAGNSPLSLPVLLNVTSTPTFNVAPQALTFSAPSGSGPLTQVLSVTGTSFFQASHVVVSTIGAAWLSASPGETDTPANIVVRVDPTQASAGTQTGTVRITLSVGGILQPDHIDIPITLTLPQLPPTIISLSPFSGTGNGVFTATFSRPGGAASIAHARLLISTSFAPSGGCYVDYAPGVGFTLMNDAGTAFSTAPNSLCALAGGASAFVSGDTLTVNYSLLFTPAFVGRRTLFLYVSDTSGNAPAPLAMGVWYPFPTAPAAIKRYRLYDTATRTHHYTTDCNEYVTLAGRGFIQEGADSAVYSGPIGTAIPFWRIFAAQSSSHFWTTDRNEYTTLITGYPGIYLGEGADAYIYPAPVAGITTMALYRLVWLGTGPPIHHWSTDATEVIALTKPGGGWNLESTVGYVLPAAVGSAAGCPAAVTQSRMVPGEVFTASGRVDSVRIDGLEAPIVGVAEGRVEAIVPEILAGRDSVTVELSAGGTLQATTTARLVDAAPRIVSATRDGDRLTLELTGLGASCANPIVRVDGVPAALQDRTIQAPPTAQSIYIQCGEALSPAFPLGH